MSTPRWRYDDGGRADAGFRGEAGDCVPRAIAIAARLDYREVYDALSDGTAAWFETTAGKRRATRGATRRSASPRAGTFPEVYRPFLEDTLGWVWTPLMAIGSGCTVHLDAEWCEAIVAEHGPVVARLSKHLVAVDHHGVVKDTHDPSRGGTRCVYGFWRRG